MKIKITGAIIKAVPDYWYNYGFVSRATHTAVDRVQEEIESLKDGAGAEVFIDSPGGSVVAGVGMAQAIRAGIKRGAISTVRVGAMAGSSAALIAVRATLDGAVLVVGSMSRMLIHKPFLDFISGGGAAALDSMSAYLKLIFSDIIDDIRRLGGEGVAQEIAAACKDSESFVTLTAGQMRDWFGAQIEEEEEEEEEDPKEEVEEEEEDEEEDPKEEVEEEEEDEEEDPKEEVEEEEEDEEEDPSGFDDGAGGAVARLIERVAAKISSQGAAFERHLGGLQCKKGANARLVKQRDTIAKLEKQCAGLAMKLANAQAAAEKAERQRAKLVVGALTPRGGKSNTIAALTAAGKTTDAWNAAIKEAGGYVQARKAHPELFKTVLRRAKNGK